MSSNPNDPKTIHDCEYMDAGPALWVKGMTFITPLLIKKLLANCVCLLIHIDRIEQANTGVMRFS